MKRKTNITRKKSVKKITKKRISKKQKGGVTGVSDIDRLVSGFLTLGEAEKMKKLSKSHQKHVGQELKKREFDKKFVDQINKKYFNQEELERLASYIIENTNDVIRYLHILDTSIHFIKNGLNVHHILNEISNKENHKRKFMFENINLIFEKASDFLEEYNEPFKIELGKIIIMKSMEFALIYKDYEKDKNMSLKKETNQIIMHHKYLVNLMATEFQNIQN